jgi:hypothetical protein
MTPRYQTSEHRRREEEVAAKLAGRWGCMMHRTPDYDHVDYFAFREDRCVAVLELKCRDHHRTKFDTVYLSARKYVALLLMGTAQSLAPLFVVQWADALGYVNVATLPPCWLHLAGRRDRGAENDIEPCFEVPVDLFTLVE